MAILSALFLSRALEAIPITVPWYVETPSVLGFFGFFYWLYDRYIWRSCLFQRLTWLSIPDLNGSWEINVRTSHRDFQTETSGFATIRQTSSSIAIQLRFPESTSSSHTASLMRSDPLAPYTLIYIFQSIPKPKAISTMEIHLGTTQLAISDDQSKLEGDYYTGRGRNNYGSIEFHRK